MGNTHATGAVSRHGPGALTLPVEYYGGKSSAATSAQEPGQTRNYHECCHAGTT